MKAYLFINIFMLYLLKFCVDSYREFAGRLSKLVKLLPRSPVQEAADWIEYTHAVALWEDYNTCARGVWTYRSTSSTSWMSC